MDSIVGQILLSQYFWGCTALYFSCMAVYYSGQKENHRTEAHSCFEVILEKHNVGYPEEAKEEIEDLRVLWLADMKTADKKMWVCALIGFVSLYVFASLNF